MMHIHISWATVLITILSFISSVGVLNLFYRANPSAFGASAWSLVASPN